MTENMEQAYKQLQEYLKSAGETARGILAELQKDPEFAEVFIDKSKLEVLEEIRGIFDEKQSKLTAVKPEIHKLRLLPEHEALKAQKARMESSGAQIAALMGKLGCPVENMEFADGYAERRTELRKYAANVIAFNKAFTLERPGNTEYEVEKTITFGTYPQTTEGTDSTPIEWLVLAKEEDKALLISKYALDCGPYNTEDTDVTWETCTLRKWLNNEFYNKAFSAEEKRNIVLSKVTADKNPKYSTNPGNDTNDNVFLLSIPEVKRYFKDNASHMCAPTDYAVKKGVYTDSKNRVDGRASCWWWLRSPGNLSSDAAGVSDGGSVSNFGNDVDNCYLCVRPCVWVRLF